LRCGATRRGVLVEDLGQAYLAEPKGEEARNRSRLVARCRAGLSMPQAEIGCPAISIDAIDS